MAVCFIRKGDETNRGVCDAAPGLLPLFGEPGYHSLVLQFTAADGPRLLTAAEQRGELAASRVVPRGERRYWPCRRSVHVQRLVTTRHRSV